MTRLSLLALLGGVCAATMAPTCDARGQAIVRDPLSVAGAATLPPLPPLEAGRSRARVTASDGRWVVGWVTSVDDTLLVVDPDERPFDLLPRRKAVYDRRRIRSLELSERPRSRAEATALGIIGGGLLGGLFGAASSGDCPENAWGPCGAGFGFAAGALIGSSIGAVLGRHVIGRDRWREIEPVAPRERDIEPHSDSTEGAGTPPS